VGQTGVGRLSLIANAQTVVQCGAPLWYTDDMAISNTPRRVTYTHPSMPQLPPMTGVVEWDDWEGQALFYPDTFHGAGLLSLYGYDPEAGLYLDGAVVTPSP
jgi:hypothetical protein